MTTCKQAKVPNILIVDDTPANLLLMTRMLTERGYQTQTVLSGKLAVQAARTEPPDLILLDLMLPDIDGFKVCETLKREKITQNAFIIMATGKNLVD